MYSLIELQWNLNLFGDVLANHEMITMRWSIDRIGFSFIQQLLQLTRPPVLSCKRYEIKTTPIKFIVNESKWIKSLIRGMGSAIEEFGWFFKSIFKDSMAFLRRFLINFDEFWWIWMNFEEFGAVLTRFLRILVDFVGFLRWILTIFEDLMAFLRRILRIFEDPWWFLDEFWRFLKIFIGFLRILWHFWGDFWSILINFDEFWWFWMNFDDFWWILGISDEIWRILWDIWGES